MSDWLELLPPGLSDEHKQAARQAERQNHGGTDYLVSRNLADLEQVLDARSRFFKLPCIRLAAYQPEEQSVALLTEEQCRKFDMFPLFKLDGRLYVALVNPRDLDGQDFVRKLTGLRVEPVLAARADVHGAINRFYLTAERAGQAIGEIAAREQEKAGVTASVTTEVLEDTTAPAVQMVERIFSQAVHLGASDIHLEPDERKVFLRYRIDGVLHDYPAPPKNIYPAIASRVKISSNLDIAEKRLPQDGRTSITVGGKAYDLRVSVIPNIHGEGIVVRILNPEATSLDLAAMGFDARMLERFERLIHRPHGIVLVTGPTGSGKSTTLYATLKRIYSRAKKIITLEDPVEYKLEGVSQIPVNADIGYTFAVGLKAILRHDPDIVMLGEIRDLESAEVAFRAALTGHMLFSTLHTNNAPLAVTRLIDMGVQPFQVTAALSGVLAQRLVRKLCAACRRPVEPEAAQMAALGLPALPPGVVVYGPKGCEECKNIGYRGRVGIYELLEITPEMRRLPSSELTADRVAELGQAAGFTTLRHAAVGKLLSGVTSLEEVMAVTTED